MPSPQALASKEAIVVLREHLDSLMAELRLNAAYSEDPREYRREMQIAGDIERRGVAALETIVTILKLKDHAK